MAPKSDEQENCGTASPGITAGPAKRLLDITNGPTPAMIEAATNELREKLFGQDLAEIVVDIFYAMTSAAVIIEQALPPVPPNSSGS